MDGSKDGRQQSTEEATVALSFRLVLFIPTPL